MTGKPIAFFDVDNTLCDCISGFHTTLELMRRNIIKKRRIFRALIYNAMGRLYFNADVRHLYEMAFVDMAGTHITDILAIGKHAFDHYVKPTLFVDALAEIEKRKAEGCAVVLISSGPYMMVKNMEAYLKADASFSNGPVILDGILQNKFQDPLCYKEGKVDIARRFAQEHGVSLEDCYFYSDSLSDMPLLSAVGKPMVVNPDYKLKRIAVQRNWPILKFVKKLGKMNGQNPVAQVNSKHQTSNSSQ